MENSISSTKGLVAVAYLPHGTMILDPYRTDLPKSVDSLHSCCTQIGERIASLDPDLLILLTPHGLLLHQSFNVYQPGVKEARASGNAEWNGNWLEYQIDIDLDGDAAQDLYHYLKGNLLNVEGMLAFAGLSIPMRWGEVVPLYFVLRPWASKTGNESRSTKHISIHDRPQLVIIGQPMKGVTKQDQDNYSSRRAGIQLSFGRLLRSWCEQSSKRIVLLISGDQSHTHPWSSQLPSIYQPDPSCFTIFPQTGNEYAKLFDEIICKWIQGNSSLYQLDEKLLVNEAGKIEKDARICGYTGSLTLQGVLENNWIQNCVTDLSSAMDSIAQWLLTDFTYDVPTYYGMMAALFVRNSTK